MSDENQVKDDSQLTLLGRGSENEGLKQKTNCLELDSKASELVKDDLVKSRGHEAPVPENPKVFYGVCLSDGSESILKGDEDALVFCDRKEALQTVKKHSGARFKVFDSREGAANFSKSLCSTPRSDFSVQDSPHHHRRAVGEKPSAFKAPRSQEMVKLRKAIECGDAEYFTKVVWSNPRYLVSCGDTPSILQEGPRYNALHMAAKHNQGAICSLVLNTLQDPTFLPIMYSDDAPEVTQQRREFITDLYLNMPEKGLCETPLHFACKFGCVKVVEVILRHPVCNTKCQNKYGKMPREVICERNGNAEARRQIDSLFEALYYVPVLRSEDNSVQPALGAPYCLSQPLKMTAPSPICPSLVVKAEAGPMTVSKADQFYKKWRMSSNMAGLDIKSKDGQNIRRSDSRKGLERIGRSLAREMNVTWHEYWSFLDTWIDLATSEGLQHLETHLRNLYHTAITENSFQESEPSSRERDTSKAMSPVSLLCRQLEGLNLDSSPLNTSPDMPALFASRSYSESSLDSFDHSGGALGGSPDLRTRPGFLSKQQKNLNFVNYNVASTTPAEHSISTNTNRNGDVQVSNKTGGIYFEELCSSVISFITFPLKNSFKMDVRQELYSVVPTFKKFLSIAHRFNELQLSVFHNDLAKEVVSRLDDEYLPRGELLTSLNCCESWLDGENKTDYSSSDEETSARNNCSKQVKMKKLVLLKKHLKCVLTQVKDIMSDCISCETSESCRCSWEMLTSKTRKEADVSSSKRCQSKDEDSYDEEFLTPPSSIVGSPLSSAEEDVFTPDEGIKIFVQGLCLSKSDLDVQNALEELTIDPMLYPHINMWKHSLKSCTKEDISSLMTPQRGKQLSFNGHDLFKSPYPKSEPSRRHPISSTPLNTFTKSESWRPQPSSDTSAQLRPKNFYDCLLNWEEIND